MYDTSMNTAMSVNRSDDNMLDVCFQDPLHNSATKEIDNVANRADQ